MAAADHNPHVQHIIQLGLVPYFIRCLKENNAEMQVEAAWALTNVSAGTTEETEVVVEQGAIPALVDIIKKDKGSLREQAIWAVGNIAAEKQFRDLLIARGALNLLLETLQDENTGLSTTRIGTWALANFCRTVFPKDKSGDLVDLVMQVSISLLSQRDKDTIVDSVWTLSSIAGWDSSYTDRIVAAGVVPHLIHLLRQRHTSILHPTLRCLASVAMGPDADTQEMMSCGVVPRLKQLLMGRQKKRVLGNLCWALANMMGCGWSMCQVVIDAGIIPLVMGVLKHGIYEVKKEAAFVVINAFNSDSIPYQGVIQLSNDGCIEALCGFLTWEQPRIVAHALEALEAALKMGELGRMNNGCNGSMLMNDSYEMTEKAHKKRVRARGFHGRSNRIACQVSAADGRETLRQLTEHECNDVASMAKELLGKYFQVDGEAFEGDDVSEVMEDGEDAGQLSTNGHGSASSAAEELQGMLEDWSVSERGPAKPPVTCAK
ncbi:unnamed protein product [Ostreobium quekettii]|uniref:Importin subunit alpha n=1 Tax=Ostreobium quekettii TaxID=121088 RepID=A0A8S1IKP2_9CHLO|nr:unnamed protein product [Ostreobium quekettii]